MDQNPIPAPDARTLRVARRASTGGGLAPPQAPILGMPPNANMPGAQREPQPHQFEAAAAAVAAAARRAAQPADQGIGHLDLPLAPSPVPLPADSPDPPGQPPAGPANPSPPPDDDYAGMTLEQARARLNGLWANRHTAGNAPPAPAGTAPTEQTGPAPALRELEDELRQRAHPELRLRLNAAFLPRRDETPPLGYQEALAAAAAAEAGDSPAFFTARDLPPLLPSALRPHHALCSGLSRTPHRWAPRPRTGCWGRSCSFCRACRQVAPEGSSSAPPPRARPLLSSHRQAPSEKIQGGRVLRTPDRRPGTRPPATVLATERSRVAMSLTVPPILETQVAPAKTAAVATAGGIPSLLGLLWSLVTATAATPGRQGQCRHRPSSRQRRVPFRTTSTAKR